MSLDQSVDKLCQLSTELNDSTDLLNQQIREFQAKLNQAGVGFGLTLDEPIEFGGSVADGGDGPLHLGWLNDEFSWGFYCIDNSKTVPLNDCPRWVRIGAFKQFPLLVEKLTSRVDTELNELKPLVPELVDDIPF